MTEGKDFIITSLVFVSTQFLVLLLLILSDLLG